MQWFWVESYIDYFAKYLGYSPWIWNNFVHHVVSSSPNVLGKMLRCWRGSPRNRNWYPIIFMSKHEQLSQWVSMLLLHLRIRTYCWLESAIWIGKWEYSFQYRRTNKLLRRRKRRSRREWKLKLTTQLRSDTCIISRWALTTWITTHIRSLTNIVTPLRNKNI